MDSRSKHLLKVGMLANLFEWFEFAIFLSLSSFIGRLFFQVDDPIAALLNAYLLFAVSFVARPLGGLFFGLLGRRVNQQFSLRLSLILMAIPTVLIGVLPTYKQAGIVATISLVVLRLIQGFAAGGELPMTACYVFESAPTHSRSFLCSVIAISPKMGMLLASLVNFLLIQFASEETILAGAWRLPFLFSMPLTLFIAYLRQAIQIPSTKKTMTAAYYANWRQFVLTLLQAVSLVSFGALYFYTLLVWIPDYLIHFAGIMPQRAHFIRTVTLSAMLPLYFLVPRLVAYYGYRKLLLGSICAVLVSIIPIFKGLQTYSAWPMLLILQLVLACLYVGVDGVIIEALGRLFPSKNSSLEFSLAWTLAAGLVGGTAPLIFTQVVHKTGWLMFPAFYVALFGALALVGAWHLPISPLSTEESQSPLEED